MTLAAPDAADEGSSSQKEPPDPIVAEIDPTRRYSRYKKILGKGAFKTVYEAFDKLHGIEVAWCQVSVDDLLHSPMDLERLFSEVRLLKTLNHKNIVKCFSSWTDEHNKTINIITELFSPGSLRQFLKKHRNVDTMGLKEWARQILVGLDYLHSQNPPIIHRDLKCDNIFINGNRGEVKIGDLGLATIMQRSNARTVIGTPEFMAPELYDEEYNELVDIYSFGMCMLEMVTLEYPYSECTNSAQIYRKVSTGVKPASLSKIKDPEVKAFIEKCLIPAAQRMPARDLLNDPFLQPTGLKTPEVNQPSQLSTSENHASGNQCAAPEAPITKVHETPFSMDVDASDSEPSLITVIEVGNGDGSQSPILEVLRKRKGSESRLKGQWNDSNCVSLSLRRAEWEGSVKCISFQLLIGRDTSLSIASKMVEHLQLSEKDIKFIAELIDTLLVNLISGWEPFVPVDHLMSVSGMQTAKGETKDVHLVDCRKSLGDSFHNSEVVSAIHPPSIDLSSNGGHFESMNWASAFVKLNKTTAVDVDLEPLNMSVSDDQVSQLSFASAASSHRSGKKCAGACACFPLAHGNNSGCSMDGKARDTSCGVEFMICIDEKDKMIERDTSAPPFFCLLGDSSVLADQNEDDIGLRMEVELIELQFQQAINEMAHKRQQAIEAAKRRATWRKDSRVC